MWTEKGWAMQGLKGTVGTLALTLSEMGASGGFWGWERPGTGVVTGSLWWLCWESLQGALPHLGHFLHQDHCQGPLAS